MINGKPGEKLRKIPVIMKNKAQNSTLKNIAKREYMLLNKINI